LWQEEYLLLRFLKYLNNYLNNISYIKNQQNALNYTDVCYILINFTYMLGPVIRPPTGWYFSYKNTVWSNVSNYSKILQFVCSYFLLFYRAFW
jgi:hypothetical protein